MILGAGGIGAWTVISADRREMEEIHLTLEQAAATEEDPAALRVFVGGTEAAVFRAVGTEIEFLVPLSDPAAVHVVLEGSDGVRGNTLAFTIEPLPDLPTEPGEIAEGEFDLVGEPVGAR